MIDFSIFNREYMWYSSLFQCHNTLQFYEDSPDYNLELIRIKFKKINFDPQSQIAEFQTTVLSPQDGTVPSQTIKIIQNESGSITIIPSNEESFGELYVESPEKDASFVSVFSNNTFKFMEFKVHNENNIFVNFLIMDNEPVTEENTISTQGRFYLTDTDKEPNYDVEGYIFTAV